MQRPYAVLVLLQPTQRVCDDDVIIILLLAVGSAQGDRTRPISTCLYRDHDGVIQDVRLPKWSC